MKDCCVVIPAYKNILDSNEENFFKNNCKVLSNYDIYLVCPKHIDTTYYTKLCNNIKIKQLDNKWFVSTDSYSKLCTNTFFYELFIDYKYMLICQTDAICFYDNLKYFIDLNYDYYGAPWPQYNDKIGNGGFCLRKISAMINVTKKYGEITLPNAVNSYNEDMYFCFLHEDELNICPLNIAIKFSVEAFPIKYIYYRLPMGCHNPVASGFTNFYKSFKLYSDIINNN